MKSRYSTVHSSAIPFQLWARVGRYLGKRRRPKRRGCEDDGRWRGGSGHFKIQGVPLEEEKGEKKSHDVPNTQEDCPPEHLCMCPSLTEAGDDDPCQGEGGAIQQEIQQQEARVDAEDVYEINFPPTANGRTTGIVTDERQREARA